SVIKLIENQQASHLEVSDGSGSDSAKSERGSPRAITGSPCRHIVGTSRIIVVSIYDANVRSKTVAGATCGENDKRLIRTGAAQGHIAFVSKIDRPGQVIGACIEEDHLSARTRRDGAADLRGCRARVESGADSTAIRNASGYACFRPIDGAA